MIFVRSWLIIVIKKIRLLRRFRRFFYYELSGFDEFIRTFLLNFFRTFSDPDLRQGEATHHSVRSKVGT